MLHAQTACGIAMDTTNSLRGGSLLSVLLTGIVEW